jgi:hypothetical protein
LLKIEGRKDGEAEVGRKRGEKGEGRRRWREIRVEGAVLGEEVERRKQSEGDSVLRTAMSHPGFLNGGSSMLKAFPFILPGAMRPGFTECHQFPGFHQNSLLM